MSIPIPILIVFACIAMLVLLITYVRINAFLAFLVISVVAGWWLGMKPGLIMVSVQKGIGDMLGSLVIVIVTGAMLGKLVADSGAAQQIAQRMVSLFGRRRMHWALMLTGFIIGIPLFYNVGFVLVVPLIFSIARQYKLPPVYTGLPMLASLSVTHGFLPPHPSPFALVGQFHADMGTTLFYGILVGLPAVMLAGPLFVKSLKKIDTPPSKTFQSTDLPESQLPSLANAAFTSLLPVILIVLTTWLGRYLPADVHKFVSDPAMLMMVSLAVATCTLGIAQGMDIRKVMNIYSESVKDIAMILLIMGGAGALKQILLDSEVSDTIARQLSTLDIHPLVLGWTIACIIRLCVGSATVAGLTAAGIIAPMLTTLQIDPNLMVLAVGAGSLMFSHVNDTGFWMFKEYFNLGIKDTIRSWSLMETIVSVAGLAGVMIINQFI